MKRFQFSLETVKLYKEKLLDGLKEEYSLCMLAVQEKEAEIASFEQKKKAIADELNLRNAQGISPSEIGYYQRYLHVLRNRIQQEVLKLVELKRQAEKKKDEMIAARTEVATFEKLKERQLEEYRKAEVKAEEQFAEEFVTRGLFRRIS